MLPMGNQDEPTEGGSGELAERERVEAAVRVMGQGGGAAIDVDLTMTRL